MHWNKKLLKHINIYIPILVLSLIIIGLFIISSATGMADGNHQPFIRTQIAAAVLGIILIIIMLFFDYRILKDYDLIIYILTIIMLGFIFVLGITVSGGRRWLSIGPVNFQPSEVSKILMIIFLAAYLDRNKNKLNNLKDLFRSLLFILPPFILIILQNDLGTSLVLIFIFVVMYYGAGGKLKHILMIFGGGFLIVVLIITSHVMLETPMPFLQQYQLNRLIAFVNPDIDPYGIGYNIIQSKIAVGSGMITGRGYLAGTQTQLNFLPEKHTDFIFAVLAEEFGFIGVAVVLIIYLLLLLQILKVAARAKDSFGQLITIGVLGLFLFHILENVGMVLGIMPITGIPLPFISYGGSFMVISLIAIGLVININMRRKKIIF
ncbi:MAG: rod shape-determining protein RodA [Halarsenatibacteraceae bacterium]